MREHPIRDMLCKYIERNPARYHMPGHKGLMNPWDVTELSATDDLNNPGYAIKRAQELLSICYQSHKSYFLCGGSTEGLKTMFRYIKLAGGGVIMPRHSHKNAFYACIENSLEPLLLNTGEDMALGALSCEQALIDMMYAHPEAGAVFITRPDYYGRCLNLKNIAEHARSLGMLVLCDSAHGAHFAVSEKLPYDAAGYADIWVQSAHKTLGALTPSAYLHCSQNIDDRLIQSILPSVRTSSPNYEIVMSMDNCRAVNFENTLIWENCLRGVEIITSCLYNTPGVRVLGKSWAERAGYQDKDDLRLVIDVSGLGGGFYVKKMLEEQNIFVEMADFRNITAIITPYDKPEWNGMLMEGINSIISAKVAAPGFIPADPCRREMTMHEAYYSGRRFVDLSSAQGQVSADAVGAYPPGTPLVLPGEVFNQSVIDCLQRIEQSGGSLFGASLGVRVV